MVTIAKKTIDTSEQNENRFASTIHLKEYTPGILGQMSDAFKGNFFKYK